MCMLEPPKWLSAECVCFLFSANIISKPLDMLIAPHLAAPVPPLDWCCTMSFEASFQQPGCTPTSTIIALLPLCTNLVATQPFPRNLVLLNSQQQPQH